MITDRIHCYRHKLSKVQYVRPWSTCLQGHFRPGGCQDYKKMAPCPYHWKYDPLLEIVDSVL